MRARDPWNEFGFNVGMPHLAAGEKLSEVEFLKTLALFQWEAIARLLGRQPRDIATDEGERLYGSVIDVELDFAHHSPESLSEGVDVFVRNRVSVFAKRFVEGFFVFSDEKIPDTDLANLRTRDDLRAQPRPWAYMTNAFIARTPGSSRLKIFVPSGMQDVEVAAHDDPPPGIEDQRRAQSSGEMDPFDDAAVSELTSSRAGPISYQMLYESDINGAGLVYFARYVAMMNYAERVFLRDHLERPLSSELAIHLSTQRRRVFYFANAHPEDRVDLYVRADILATRPAEVQSGRFRTPFELEFRIDAHRGSDKVLMAGTRVRKSLTVPANEKSVLMEAERFLSRLG